MSGQSIAVLLNVGGFLLALVLYTMLLALVWRERRAPGAGHGRERDDLPLVTGALGVAWNLGAFLAHRTGYGAEAHAPTMLAVVSYAALGFLPAVFVSGALRADLGPRLARALRFGAYALSAAASVLHGTAAWRGGEVPSPEALRLLAGGFLVAGAALALWPRPGGRLADRAVGATALAAFAFSAFHIAAHEPGGDNWSSAFFGHHASIPLALAILYQDYRFALADLFLKRALSLLATAGVCLALFLAGSGGAARALADGDPAPAILFIALWVGMAVAYGRIRKGVDWFVDRVVLGRPDYADARAAVARALEQAESPDQALADVAERLADALGTPPITVRSGVDADRIPSRALASMPVPTAEQPRYTLEIPSMPAGRRLLSDERALLDATALALARRIDVLRLSHERFERHLREQEVARLALEAERLALEAELRALHAQLNPHFLFNALNTLGYLMRRAPERATDTLQQLTSVLRKVLRRREGQKVTLGDELELVESYLAIEAARFEERLSTRVDVPPGLREAMVPPLVLQPLVENAVCHGIAPSREGGRVVVSARLDAGEAQLVLTVSNTGAVGGPNGHGVGLANLEKRLRAHYGDSGSVHLERFASGGAVATVHVPFETRGAVPAVSA